MFMNAPVTYSLGNTVRRLSTSRQSLPTAIPLTPLDRVNDFVCRDQRIPEDELHKHRGARRIS